MILLFPKFQTASYVNICEFLVSIIFFLYSEETERCHLAGAKETVFGECSFKFVVINGVI